MPATDASEQPLEARFSLSSGADPVRTMSALWQGPGDPQMRVSGGGVERASRLRSGPASVRLEIRGDGVVARAWGAGAREMLTLIPALLGEADDPSPLVARHAIVADLQRRLAGLRLTSGAPVMETLVPSIIGQKITSLEARRSHRALIRRHGERAPGPLGLLLPPSPRKLATLPYWAFHPLGIERRRADTIRASAAVADRLERLGTVEPGERMRRITAVPGIGQWTAAETLRLAFGDPDAVSVGDFHLPRLVCRALAGDADGDDARMLELLEPYRGQRARVVLLIENGGFHTARRAPRMATRSIARI